jgi:hypothetical protein
MRRLTVQRRTWNSRKKIPLVLRDDVNSVLVLQRALDLGQQVVFGHRANDRTGT